MDEHGVPEDPGRPPDRPILDPREARARHRRRTTPSAGLLYLQSLAAEERTWMVRMVTTIARAYNVDRDDLLQELQLSLLGCESIDRGRQEVRAWLTRRAKWRAADMVRRDLPRREYTRSLNEGAVPEPTAPEPTGPDLDWTIDRLCGLRLNRDEAQVVLLVLWGLDVSMRDFAELAGRSYEKARKDKSRGLNRIKELFDLEPQESAAFIALREFGTVSAAAVRLGIPDDELRQLVRRAESQINRTLGHAEYPSGTRRDEDDSDAR